MAAAAVKSEEEEEPGLELEHAIGFCGYVHNHLFYQKLAKDKFIYAAGGSIVLSDFNDPHEQVFFQGHDKDITCIAISASGSLIASGQAGFDADVIVWDHKKKKLVYRFQEHDYGLQSLAFSHDERLLATVGVAADKKLIVWDLATGSIVASMVPRSACFNVVTFGGMLKDVKRRETRSYLLAVAGDKKISLFSLDPYSGSLEQKEIQMGTAVRNFSCLAFSRDYENLYAGSTSGDISVFNMKHCSFVTTFPVCSIGVGSIAVGVDKNGSDILCIGGGDGVFSVWERKVDYYGKASYVKMRALEMDGKVTSISLLSETDSSGREVHSEALFGTAAGFVQRMSLHLDQEETAKPAAAQMLVCENHCGPVTGVAYSANASDRFATCSRDCSVRIWDASDYTVCNKAFVRDAGAPAAITYSTDHLFTGWDDGRVRCHAAFDGQLLWFLNDAHKVVRGHAVSALCLSHNEKFLLSGGEDGAVRVWEVRTRDMVTHLKEHKSRVSQLALFSDDVHAVSCSQDRSFLCWDLRAEKRISTHTQRTGGINAISLSCDQTVVLTCGKEQAITFWDLREPHPVQTITPAHNGEGTCISVMHNNDFLFATGGNDQKLKLWDMRTCRMVTEGLGHSGTINSCAFSPDDKQLISAGEDGNIFVWNLYL